MTEISGQHAFVTRPDRGLPRRLPQHPVSGVLVPLSQAIDLAEGRPAGHAQRVSYVAMSIAEAMGLERDAQLHAVYAGLLHDLGTIAAGAEISGAIKGDERFVFAALPLLTPEEALSGSGDHPFAYADRVAGHVMHGARAVEALGLNEDVARAVATHHEQWNGEGYPDGLVGQETPILGRIVGLADRVEALIAQTTPLMARRNFAYWMESISGSEADPQVVEAATRLGHGDEFWLGLYSGDLTLELAAQCGKLREPRGATLLPMAESFARLVDGRFSFTVNVSARVANYSEMLAKAMGLPDITARKLRVAAHLHDLGQLSISESVLAKPGILSVEEMDALHLHPIYSREIVAGIQGLEDVAEWVEAHHERIDGRGYPEGRRGDEIPVEARILAVADAYVAITSDRPHRPRTNGRDARARLKQAAGSQLDSRLVDLFLENVLV